MATSRRAQALVEMAMGMLALALLLAALFAFTSIILDSLDMQRELRRDAGVQALTSIGDDTYREAKKSEKVEVSSFASTYLFGTETFTVIEEVHMPAMQTQVDGGK